MAIKNIDYSFKRGDTQPLKKFRITDSKGNILTLTNTEQLYFTMKKSTKVLEYILQKKIGTGITLEEDGFYHITLNSRDTRNLNYGTYYYDIELKSTQNGEMVKTIIEGTITLEEEVTWGGNE